MRMLKNNRAQTIFVGIMTAVLVFITLVVLIGPIKDQVVTARTTLDCTNSSISTGTKASCILVDWYLPYFICAGIAVSAGFVTQRRFVTVQQ